MPRPFGVGMGWATGIAPSVTSSGSSLHRTNSIDHMPFVGRRGQETQQALGLAQPADAHAGPVLGHHLAGQAGHDRFHLVGQDVENALDPLPLLRLVVVLTPDQAGNDHAKVQGADDDGGALRLLDQRVREVSKSVRRDRSRECGGMLRCTRRSLLCGSFLTDHRSCAILVAFWQHACAAHDTADVHRDRQNCIRANLRPDGWQSCIEGKEWPAATVGFWLDLG